MMAEGKVFAVLGHPVAHSLSPVIHTVAYASLGLPHVYRAIDVPTAGELLAVVDEVRRGAIAGANVTLPHKRAVLDLADEVDTSAAEPGAANVLCRGDDGRLRAYNTDADALADDIAALAPDASRKRAMIIGAGGAGVAAVAACKKLGFKVIAVTSRSWARSENVETAPSAEQVRRMGALPLPWPSPGEPAPDSFASQALRLQWWDLARGASLVVQATSAGMLGKDPGESVRDVVPWDDLGSDTFAYDVVYTPRMTPFLHAAASRGLRAEGGLGMLVRQAARSIVLWTGQEPPLDVMRRAAEDTLDRGGHTV
ncbi:shikimate dehydrogenase [Polyangium jinanense]|uniref:shikimate dehydrogenase family protein n=1 Tax=Polyangium jinanense TaxID=2829994 RepID=UPI0023424151|nr:shikimate dehydrogenase [Polyangium jinanense]MDC3957646.1 shikimate dehydrogenase [Polyangium jinanense]